MMMMMKSKGTVSIEGWWCQGLASSLFHFPTAFEVSRSDTKFLFTACMHVHTWTGEVLADASISNALMIQAVYSICAVWFDRIQSDMLQCLHGLVLFQYSVSVKLIPCCNFGQVLMLIAWWAVTSRRVHVQVTIFKESYFWCFSTFVFMMKWAAHIPFTGLTLFAKSTLQKHVYVLFHS